MGIGEDIKQAKFTSEYSKAIINILYSNSWLIQKHSDLLKPSGITIPQFNVLRILRGQYPKPATVNLLIERMLDKSSNASRIVDKLEEKRFVERKKCKFDKRAVDVVITDKGLELLQNLDVQLNAYEERNKKLTDEECETLNALLDKMRS